ncbi:MAG: D-alanyl-D-alanine carboxypeptidase, partial [Atopobiaceae bacterium]|nr:D-alanyl-D-alanine carboxypeptidase [Atopobiaceae bacterium]
MRIRPVLLSLLASLALVCTPAYAFETAPEVEEAQAAIVVDSSGSILWSKNAEREMGMASVTKVMTAVVALDSGMDLDTVCSIDYVDLGPYSQTAGFTSDDAPTLRDLLRVMLVYSGNDAACYVAQNVAGSVDEFVVLMNAKARELGMNHTHFANPHGLEEDGHYSTV